MAIQPIGLVLRCGNLIGRYWDRLQKLCQHQCEYYNITKQKQEDLNNTINYYCETINTEQCKNYYIDKSTNLKMCINKCENENLYYADNTSFECVYMCANGVANNICLDNSILTV